MLACFRHIEEYLTLPDMEQESGPVLQFYSLEDGNSDRAAEKPGISVIIELTDAYIAPFRGATATLRNITFSVKLSQVIAVLGPIGSGKSLLLQAILGEAALLQGQARRKKWVIAYCGQKVWLRNQSLRDCIVGMCTFDAGFYETVLDVCRLRTDLLLPGDSDDRILVGHNGSRLSAGQRQRVVSLAS